MGVRTKNKASEPMIRGLDQPSWFASMSPYVRKKRAEVPSTSPSDVDLALLLGDATR